MPTIKHVTSNLAAGAAALAGAFFLASAAALQQRGAASVPGRGMLRPALLLDLARTPIWLAGTVAGLAGVGLQVLALRWGPLALVQPLGVTTLLFALPVGAAMWGRRVTRVEMYAAAAVGLGLGGLLMTLHTPAVAPALDPGRLTIVGFVVAGGLAACGACAFRLRGEARTILLAVGAGLAFGTTAALVEVLVDQAAVRGPSVLVSWLTPATLAASAAGFVLCQGAYRSGQLSTALATILVLDPLTAIGVGRFALREPVSTSVPLAIVAETLLLVAGIVVLARSSHGTRRVHSLPSPPPRSAAPEAARPLLIGTDTYLPDVNGAARFTHRLASGLAARGHDVHVVAPSTSREAYRQRVDGVTVHRLPSRSTPFHPTFRVCLAPRAGVDRVVADVRPAVIHIQGHFLIGRALSALARRDGFPLVATNHFMPENLLPYASVPAWLERPLAAAALRDLARVLRRAHAVTTPTRIAAELIRAGGLSRPVMPISCGIDLDRFAPYEGRRDPALFGLPDRPTLLYVGRLDAEKRIGDLLDAMPAVRERVDAQLVIVGVGTRRGELENRARERGVADLVRFLGYVPEERLPLVYTVADVFCMPGVAELQSLVTLEAMASARPVVAADAMALPHLVRPGHNGFRYEPGDTRALAGHLVALLEDPALRRSMGRASRTIAAEHDVARSLDRFEELYDEAAAMTGTIVPTGTAEVVPIVV